MGKIAELPIRRAYLKAAIAFSFSGMQLIQNAHASSLFGFATLELQVTQNYELIKTLSAMKAIATKEFEKYKKIYDTYQEMVRAAKKLSYDHVSEAMRGAEQQLSALRNFKTSIDNIQGNVSNIQRAWETRFAEAGRAGQTFQGYVESQKALLEQGNKIAIARIQNEKRMYDSVEEDFRKAKKWGDQINKTEGVQQAMGLFNTQMNHWIQQNARVVQLLAQAQGFDKAKAESAEAAEKLDHQQRALQNARRHARETEAARQAFQREPISQQ